MGETSVKILISPNSPSEAKVAWECGADIIDIKNIHEGSLGASFPWVIREVIERIPDQCARFSATLGDLPFKPGTASLAALGAVVSGVHYVKAGLHGPKSKTEGVKLMGAVVRTCKDYNPAVQVVAAGYADYRRFGGLDPQTLIAVAAESGADMVLVDTFFKDGNNLFDAMTEDEIGHFVEQAHRNRLKAGLAGSLRLEHLPTLVAAGADVIGVRGAVCIAHDRAAGIDAALTREFLGAAHQLRERQDDGRPQAVAS
jgi:hypothetical protein